MRLTSNRRNITRINDRTRMEYNTRQSYKRSQRGIANKQKGERTVDDGWHLKANGGKE